MMNNGESDRLLPLSLVQRKPTTMTTSAIADPPSNHSSISLSSINNNNNNNGTTSTTYNSSKQQRRRSSQQPQPPTSLHRQPSQAEEEEEEEDSRRVLKSRPSGVIGCHGDPYQDLGRRGESHHWYDEELTRKAGIRRVVMPWSRGYRRWWTVTVVGAMVTAFFVPYQLAFQKSPENLNIWKDPGAVGEVLLTSVFAVDIVVNFLLAVYRDEVLVFELRTIAGLYLSKMFWIDLLGVFPFESMALWISGNLGGNNNNDTATADSTTHSTTRIFLLYSLWRLPRFVRLHRLGKLNHMLQYDGHVSLLWFTLIRNFAAVLLTTHMEACAMYFIARMDDFSENTWLGPLVQNLNGLERYVSTLYFCIVTFCTVGYGDYAPKNAAEMIAGSIFMLLNIVVAAWIVGSVTLLIIKGDEKTNEYRDSLETLREYGKMHDFDDSFMGKLKSQLRLTFQNREISDESVLKNFPSALRRRILRKLYLQPLLQTTLMKGVRQQFVDAFLASCTVEIFSPGEEIVERGSILSDLFLLVGGIAEVTTSHDDTRSIAYGSSTMDESHRNGGSTASPRRKFEPGDFMGEIGFFTQSPQVDSVTTLTTCKMLTIAQSQYKNLEIDHPGSTGRILDNLLAKVEEASLQLALPHSLSILRAGSYFQDRPPDISLDTEDPTEETAFSFEYGAVDGSVPEDDERRQKKQALTAVTELVKMHMSKQLDDQTTRLLFAASRGDTDTIKLMCDQGFDPNNSDYDNRTALMVSSMKGNTQVVGLLLEYNADPNLTDMHGTTALLEAVKHGHEDTIELLKRNGGQMCMVESLAASVLCQAVFDGDSTLLRRLLKAGINVNAVDYDKRSAGHIAAAEGNLSALRVLAQHGADLKAVDRWGNTPLTEAQRLSSRAVTDFLRTKTRK